MLTSREQRIRMLAYRIWESEGRPDDQEARHWEMAERIVEAENAREEEQDWQAASDEPSLYAGEDPPAEPDELGIDESRLPLDDPEMEALKEDIDEPGLPLDDLETEASQEDSGVELQTEPSQPSAPANGEAIIGNGDKGKPAPRKRAATKNTAAKSTGTKSTGTKSTAKKSTSAKSASAKSADGESKKPASKARKPRGSSSENE